MIGLFGLRSCPVCCANNRNGQENFVFYSLRAHLTLTLDFRQATDEFLLKFPAMPRPALNFTATKFRQDCDLNIMQVVQNYGAGGRRSVRSCVGLKCFRAVEPKSTIPHIFLNFTC
jgi:hypothetical protein